MRLLALLIAALQPAATMSELMVNTIYPASDAVFYIATRTPSSDAEWTELESKAVALAEAAAAMTTPMYFRDRDRWMADARLMIDASNAAVAAARRRDVAALVELNDALHTSCVQCHQHYRPNYGRRAGPTDSAGRAPDLEGVWSFATITPLERPAEFAEKPELTAEEAADYERRMMDVNNRDRRNSSAEADLGGAYNEFWWDRGTRLATVRGKKLTSLIVDPPDGRIPPLTPEGQRRAVARAAERRDHPADGPESRSLTERCLVFNAGPPMASGPYNNYVQIFQFPDYVVILNEMIHDARIVPLNGRPRPPAALRRWQGDSRGRYDGRTLVVDTTNFTDKTNFRGADEHLHLVERFTRVDDTTLLYEFTVDNPTAFSRPWTAVLPMTKTGDRLFEYACHEANYALEGILRGARATERR
jgi:mono/diheme cytochrome c family protein